MVGRISGFTLKLGLEIIKSQLSKIPFTFEVYPLNYAKLRFKFEGKGVGGTEK